MCVHVFTCAWLTDSVPAGLRVSGLHVCLFALLPSAFSDPDDCADNVSFSKLKHVAFPCLSITLTKLLTTP